MSERRLLIVCDVCGAYSVAELLLQVSPSFLQPGSAFAEEWRERVAKLAEFDVCTGCFQEIFTTLEKLLLAMKKTKPRTTGPEESC